MPGNNSNDNNNDENVSERLENNEIFQIDNDVTSSTTSKSSSSSNVPVNNYNNNNDDGDGDKDDQEQSSRSTSSSNVNSMPIFGITPPNFIQFEEIMKTANEMNRMALMNEIIFNQDFKLERKEDTLPTSSSATSATTNDTNQPQHQRISSPSQLETIVRETMKKAFWDILQEQLNEQPPNYIQTLKLIQEIKETLLTFLMPQHVQLRQEIEQILDLELIQQQIENNSFDYKHYAHYVLNVCGRLCCPSRDDMIKQLYEVDELIPLFKGIFELLELMQLDFANFYIRQFRPHIQLASVEYERAKFKNLIETQKKYHIDVLEFTTKWLRRNYENLDLQQELQENDMKNVCNKVLMSSYMELLHCSNPSFNCYKQIDDNSQKLEDDYPETLLLIRNRIDLVREKILKVTKISSIFVVTFAAIGEPLQSIKDYRMKLKKELEAILVAPKSSSFDKIQLLQFMKSDDLKSLLESLALHIQQSIRKALVDYKAPMQISDEKLESLKLQITELSSNNNRIRSVMERRILEFIERVIQSKPQKQSQQSILSIQVPKGLSTFSDELINIASEFTRFVSYNRAVYSPYYTKILSEIISPNNQDVSGGAKNSFDMKQIEESFYG